MGEVSRRVFMHRASVAAAVSALPAPPVLGAPTPTEAGSETEWAEAPPFRNGVESVLPGPDWYATIYGTFLGATFNERMWRSALRELGGQFTLFYDALSPKKPQACTRITDMCRRNSMPYLFNNTYGDVYGPWQEGKGRAEYADGDLEYAQASGWFQGVILDEVEHRQLHHVDTGPGPYLADVAGRSLQECYDLLLSEFEKLVARYSRYGGQTVAEMVFPSMAHVMARAGLVLAPKFLWTTIPPVAFAVCAGAAKQYGRSLWAVHDFWSYEPFWGQMGAFAPGFGPETYRSALLLSYWLGVDTQYTEGLHNLIWQPKVLPEEERLMAENPFPHRPPSERGFYHGRPYHLNAYGKIHRWFALHYVPNHPRPYSFRDLRPRVAVIRFPDTLWARPDERISFPFQGLYGPGGPPAKDCHVAWLGLWHALSHGHVPVSTVSPIDTEPGRAFLSEVQKRGEEAVADDAMDADYPYVERIDFAPLDGVLVFDHLAGRKDFGDAELIVLTGETISEETAREVAECVSNGTRCLSLPHLLPMALGQGIPASGSYGKGEFLSVESFESDVARRFIAPHLGPPNLIRYAFGRQVVEIERNVGYGRGLMNRADT